MTKSIYWEDPDGYDSIWWDPNEIDDVTLDWSRRVTGTTISTSTWTVESGGVTVDSSSTSGMKATARLSGDPSGRSELVNTVTFADGRKKQWTIRVYEREH